MPASLKVRAVERQNVRESVALHSSDETRVVGLLAPHGLGTNQ